ncbi:hypothetical protein ATJ93_4662 [Halopiger aswanensis]|uniref:Uncharacterized protein n=1 Tax=Halopiger aswanensis TaxID=148449 RepID=A0A3R7DWE0_9EURY|nr:hypothetical protein ATJ93_4662 [Halopiger aswanensis]
MKDFQRQRDLEGSEVDVPLEELYSELGHLCDQF